MSDSWEISIRRLTGPDRDGEWTARMERGGIAYGSFGDSQSEALKNLVSFFKNPMTALEIDAMRSLCLWVIDQAWEDWDGL